MITFDTNVVAGNATTQYFQFEYNSMAKFGRLHFCASENGLYQIEGSADISPPVSTATETVVSYFEPVTMDFGISSQKRLRAVYVGYESNASLTLKINTELVSAQSYTLPATVAGQYARKVVVSRILKGRYWTFQIYGSGAVFAIDSIKVLPILRGHGFDQN